MSSARQITEADILPLAEYGRVRADRRRAITALKRNRRLAVGPFATFHFECFDTMLHQVQEMLYIEKGGAAQLPDELAAYNPLIPQGRELVATLMLEIEDPGRRTRILATLGGIEHTAFIRVGGETVKSVAEDDQERTREDGKASSVHFLHFPFTQAAVSAFRAPGAEVTVGFSHPAYSHLAIMPAAMREVLAGDFA
jgi:hypothetical protein